MTTRNDDATLGRVYGGDSGLIHIADGERANVGRELAQSLDRIMRRDALNEERRTAPEIMTQTLCPGCYMVALFNAAVTLAERNGQSFTELGNSMAQAFAELARGGADRIESIAVLLDPPDPEAETLEARQARYDWWDAAALVAARYGLGGYPV